MDEKDQRRRWFEIVLPTPAAYAEPLTAALAELGYPSCELREQASGSVDVVVYCEVADHDAAVNTGGALEKKLPRDLTDRLAGKLTVAAVDESVWTENWKRYFPATEIGRRLLVVPPWEATADAAVSERVVVVINPAMAFGTGHHETTASCLEVIDALVEPGWQVADVGCGSGILAIAALRLGAAAAIATDNDPLAVNAARANAVSNGVDGRLRVHLREGPPSGERFDLVVANIYAEKLAQMAASLTSCVKSGGFLTLSGIEVARRSLIEDAFVGEGWPVRRVGEAGEWLTLTLQRVP